MLRYGVSMLPMECGDGFPIKTLLTNIVGCFLIGIIVMLSGKYSKLSPEMTLMLKKVRVSIEISSDIKILKETAGKTRGGKKPTYSLTPRAPCVNSGKRAND